MTWIESFALFCFICSIKQAGSNKFDSSGSTYTDITSLYISEWALTLTRFLKDQLQKVIDHYQGSGSGLQTSFLTAGGSSMVDVDSAMKVWNFCCDLTKHLYEVIHVIPPLFMLQKANEKPTSLACFLQ